MFVTRYPLLSLLSSQVACVSDPCAKGNGDRLYPDKDGDGFPEFLVSTDIVYACEQNRFPNHIFARPDMRWDCDDSDAAINPDALPICGDGKDNNCDKTSFENGIYLNEKGVLTSELTENELSLIHYSDFDPGCEIAYLGCYESNVNTLYNLHHASRTTSDERHLAESLTVYICGSHTIYDVEGIGRNYNVSLVAQEDDASFTKPLDSDFIHLEFEESPYLLEISGLSFYDLEISFRKPVNINNSSFVNSSLAFTNEANVNHSSISYNEVDRPFYAMTSIGDVEYGVGVLSDYEVNFNNVELTDDNPNNEKAMVLVDGGELYFTSGLIENKGAVHGALVMDRTTAYNSYAVLESSTINTISECEVLLVDPVSSETSCYNVTNELECSVVYNEAVCE